MGLFVLFDVTSINPLPLRRTNQYSKSGQNFDFKLRSNH